LFLSYLKIKKCENYITNVNAGLKNKNLKSSNPEIKRENFVETGLPERVLFPTVLQIGTASPSL